MVDEQDFPEKNKQNSAFPGHFGDDNIYRSLFKESKAVMLLIDPGTSRIIDANTAACNFYGWTYEELTDKRIDQINILSTEKIKYEMQSAVEEKRNHFLFKHRLSNGDIRDVEIYSSPISIGSRNLLYSIIHDITERKLAEDELKKKKIQLSTAQKVGHVGSYEIDLNSGLVDASEEAVKIYGVENTDLNLENIQKVPLPEYRQMLDETLKGLIEKEEPYNVQFKIKRQNDAEIRDIHSIAEYYKKRNVVTGTIQDITEFKLIENELVHARFLAEAANRSKDEFLTTMSHELRTPLTSIIGFSDILLEGVAGGLNDKQTRYVRHILKGGNHLLELINNILDISKIEAGKMELYYEKFFIKEAVDEVRSMVNPLALKKNIGINFHSTPDIKEIEADKTKLKQMLYNLVSNAIKFTDDSGTIMISAELTDGMLEISVKDNGIGIAKEEQEKLFQPFRQLSQSTTGEYKGTGLGLALVKKFAEMHGGSVWVESEPGKGSTFTFTIRCQ